MWTEKGYHKDVAILSEEQVHMSHEGMECRAVHLVRPVGGIRVVIDPKQFPEAVEFEVIVERYG